MNSDKNESNESLKNKWAWLSLNVSCGPHRLMLMVLLNLFYQNLFNDINNIIIKILVSLQDFFFFVSLSYFFFFCASYLQFKNMVNGRHDSLFIYDSSKCFIFLNIFYTVLYSLFLSVLDSTETKHYTDNFKI
jgi:hypothetical protein